MSEYEVTDNVTGKTLILEGEGGPPTETELHQIFGTGGSFQNLKSTGLEMMGARPATFGEKYVDPVLQKIQPFFSLSPRKEVETLASIPGRVIESALPQSWQGKSLLPNMFVAHPTKEEFEGGEYPQYKEQYGTYENFLRRPTGETKVPDYEGVENIRAGLLNVNPALLPNPPGVRLNTQPIPQQPSPVIEGAFKTIGAPLAGLNQLMAGATSPEAPLYINPYTRALMVAGMAAQAPENVQQAVQDVKGPSDIPKAAVDVAGTVGLPIAIGASLADYGPKPTGITQSELVQGGPSFPFMMRNRPGIPMEDRPQFQERPPLIGQRPLTVEQQVIKPSPRVHIEEESPRPGQDLMPETRGKISFTGEGIPSAMQAKEMVPQTRLQSGIDPDSLRTAIKVGERLLVGLRGESHRETLERYGYSGDEYPFESPTRGFISTTRPNEFMTRKEAEQASGMKGTADLPGGGLDSSDLPGINMAAALRKAGFSDQEIEAEIGGQNALRELRTSDVSKTQAPGNLQKVGKEVRTGAEEKGVARLEPQAQARREEVAPVSTPMGMGRSLKNLINIYLGRAGAKGGAGKETIFPSGKKIEDFYPDELAQTHDQLKAEHESRLKEVSDDEKGQVARDMENTLWQEIRNKLFSLGLKKGENVTGATLEELQREQGRIKDQLDQQFQSGGKKLQDKAEQALMRDLQRVTELIKKQEEGGTKLYSGISIQPVVDLLKKADNDRKTLFKMASIGYRKINDQVFAKRDAVDNAPLITANRAEGHLDLTATKDFGKEAEQADKAVIAVLAGRKAGLNNLATLVAGKNKEAEAAVRFAGANASKLQNLVRQVEAIDAQNVAMAKANGVHIPILEDYLKQAYKTEDQGLLFGRRGGPGIGLGSKLPRKYPNIFEAIADGREPLSLSAKALVGKRTAEIQREINQKLWLDHFRTVTDKDTKQSIVTDLKHMGPNRPSMPKEGYSKVEGLNVGIHKGYEPLFITATGKSIAEGSRTMQAALQAEGAIKHGTLAFDFYHLFRVAMLGGRAGVGVRGLPFGSMGRRGVSLLDYSAKDLVEAVRQGKAPPEAVAYQNEAVDIPQGKLTRREVGSFAVKAGLNVGRHSEALYTSFVREFPGLKQTIGKTNRYIFDTLSRGVAYEGFQIEFERLANANPKMSTAEVARNVARDINFRLGNIGRQGLIKSQSMQDLTSLLFLAPRWVESMGQSEVRAAGQVGKALGTLSPTKVGTLGKSTATLVGAFFIATQALNYVINGRSTFDNPDNKGHEVDLWIPPLKEGEKGFYVSPFSVPMELTHDMLRYTRGGQTVPDALARIAENKLSPLSQGVSTFLSGRDYRGEEVDRVKGALGAALNPLPLPIRQGLQSAREKSLAPFERQTFSLLGVKAEPETMGEQRSREAEGKDLTERAIESGVQRISRPQRSPAEKLLAETATSRNSMRRGTDMLKTMSKADQNWYNSRGLFLPGFDNKVKIGGENVNLTEKEMTRYTELVKVGYEEATQLLRDNYDSIEDRDEKQKLYSEVFVEARKAAREQLISELISESEKDRKGRKFKALQ